MFSVSVQCIVLPSQSVLSLGGKYYPWAGEVTPLVKQPEFNLWDLASKALL